MADRPSTLAGATGRGVRVAVIDSGVAYPHPHIGALAGGAAVASDGTVMVGIGHAADRLGHGTAVMAAIQEKAPAADYIAVKVFHEGLRTAAATLVRAIDWCVSEGVDVVNLSLGTVNEAHRDAFALAAGRAAEAGCLLVAAREADGRPCYPGALPEVLGVGLDWDCPRGHYRVAAEDGPAFSASGYPRPVPGVPPARNLHGISFAVANMTGFVARACEVVGPAGDAPARIAAVRDLLVREGRGA